MSRSKKWLLLLGLAGGIALSYALLSSAIYSARDAARGSICNKHFKQIGLALLNYEDAYGTFPPAYFADANGRPMHSWRVLILPFLEEHALYSQYDLNESWNGPNNQRLANRMPDVFQCPAATSVTPGFTSYLASVGLGRFFDGTRSRRKDEITDGLSNTMVMIESPTQVPWLDPLDGASADAPVMPTAPHKPHPPRTNVLLADGSVQNLNNMSPLSIEAMRSISGGEQDFWKDDR